MGVAVNPGAIDSDHFWEGQVPRWLEGAYRWLRRRLFLPCEICALPAVAAAIVPLSSLCGEIGSPSYARCPYIVPYFLPSYMPTKISELGGPFYAGCRRATPDAAARDQALGQKLWELSEALCQK